MIEKIVGAVIAGLALLEIVAITQPDPVSVVKREALTRAYQTGHPYLIRYTDAGYFLQEEPVGWYPTGMWGTNDWDVAYPSPYDKDLAQQGRDEYQSRLERSNK